MSEAERAAQAAAAAQAGQANQVDFDQGAGAVGAEAGQPAAGAPAAGLPAPHPANFRGDVIKLIPKYVPGITPWTAYREAVLMHANLDLCRGASDYTLKVAVRNYGLDPALQHRLRGRLIPQPGDNVTLRDYLTLLGQEFEGELYSEDWRNQYRDRVQYEGESVASYFEVKLTLYQNATPNQYQDPAAFYRAVIEGLLNNEVKDRALDALVLHNFDTMAAAPRFKTQLIAISNLLKTKVSLGIRPSSAAIGTTGPTPYMMGPDPTNAAYASQRRPGYLNAMHPGSAPSNGAKAWTASTVPEPTVNALTNHGRPSYPARPAQPGPGRSAAPRQNNIALDQNLCFWCLEKGHYKNECPKAAAGIPKAVNAMGSQYFTYDEEPAGHDPDSDSYGDVHYMDRRRHGHPSLPRQNPGGGFYRHPPARGRGHSKPRYQVRQRAPGYRIHALSSERPLTDFIQYGEDGTVTLPANMVEALQGLTVDDVLHDERDVAPPADETALTDTAPYQGTVHAVQYQTVPDHFLV